MIWLVLLAPLLFALLAFYVVVKLTLLLLYVVFAPVLWLAGRPTRQRVELRYYDRR